MPKNTPSLVNGIRIYINSGNLLPGGIRQLCTEPAVTTADLQDIHVSTISFDMINQFPAFILPVHPFMVMGMRNGYSRERCHLFIGIIPVFIQA